MEYAKEALEGSKVGFTFDVGEEKWQQTIMTTYLHTKNKYAVEGFRKGKAPKKLIENYYGEGVFYEDAYDALLNEAYMQILQENGTLKPVAKPEVDLVEVDAKHVKFVITFTVYPEVKLGAYTGISVDKEAATVSDEQVEAEIKMAQERLARFENVTDRAVIEGDKVNIDFSGSLNGVKFEGGTAEKQDLVIGSHSFIPGMEEGMIGMTIGEVRNLDVTFPEDYQEKTLAGQPVTFEIKLNSIEVKQLPEADDEFAKDLGEFDTFADYKKSIYDKLMEKAVQKADADAEDKLIKIISDATEVIIPQAMIDERTDRYVEEFSYRLQQQGLELKRYLEYTNMDEAKLKEMYKGQAEISVKTSIVLDAIIEKEGISAPQEKIDATIEEYATMYGEDVEAFKKRVTENAEMLDYVKNQVDTQLVMEYLKANNTIK